MMAIYSKGDKQVYHWVLSADCRVYFLLVASECTMQQVTAMRHFPVEILPILTMLIFLYSKSWIVCPQGLKLEWKLLIPRKTDPPFDGMSVYIDCTVM